MFLDLSKLSNQATCLICEKIKNLDNQICEDCRKQYAEYKWTLTCNCETDYGMTICRDCKITTKIKEKWLKYADLLAIDYNTIT